VDQKSNTGTEESPGLNQYALKGVQRTTIIPTKDTPRPVVATTTAASWSLFCAPPPFLLLCCCSRRCTALVRPETVPWISTTRCCPCRSGTAALTLPTRSGSANWPVTLLIHSGTGPATPPATVVAVIEGGGVIITAFRPSSR
jgi:hypothetical protein